ncbi:hypothetical protein [Streptomyces sp. WM6378]|uniref:hypothetical protein n=1 Tax=Streptomyces sp. WM6378 TaxID=1415557 RepID=UPI000A485B67|nr:hypothetical protein [Streptomyces sp. WM6378]
MAIIRRSNTASASASSARTHSASVRSSSARARAAASRSSASSITDVIAQLRITENELNARTLPQPCRDMKISVSLTVDLPNPAQWAFGHSRETSGRDCCDRP